MLGDSEVGPVIAVNDLEAAQRFYGEVLGLKQVTDYPGGLLYKSGNSELFIYQSEHAGTNKANYAGWTVDNIEKTIDELKGRGVRFEHYPDMEGVTLEGDLHVMGEMKAAWFKDPDGNIFVINNKL